MTDPTSTELVQAGLEPEVLRYREAYLRLEPRILAIPHADIVPIRIDVRDSIQRVLAAAPRIATYRAEAAQLPFFDAASFDDLEPCALALGHAHTCYLMTSDGPDPARELSQRARDLRGDLRIDVRALTRRGL